jgi:hypothetical protein
MDFGETQLNLEQGLLLWKVMSTGGINSSGTFWDPECTRLPRKRNQSQRETSFLRVLPSMIGLGSRKGQEAGKQPPERKGCVSECTVSEDRAFAQAVLSAARAPDSRGGWSWGKRPLDVRPRGAKEGLRVQRKDWT